MERGDEDSRGMGLDHGKNRGRAGGNMAIKKGFRLVAKGFGLVELYVIKE